MRFQYSVFSIEVGRLEDRLNEMAAEGWRLVTLRPYEGVDDQEGWHAGTIRKWFVTMERQITQEGETSP